MERNDSLSAGWSEATPYRPDGANRLLNGWARRYDDVVGGSGGHQAAQAQSAEGPAPDHGRLRRFRPAGLGDLPSLSLRWAGRRQFQEHLQAMPVVAGCSRRQIWRLGRWGDIIEVQPRSVLAREDRSNHWFFVVLSGSVKVTHKR